MQEHEVIRIEPQVVHFNREPTQTLKIINNTSNTLNNFFFCLYNVEKFTFKPETFSLAPHEHKLVEVVLKIKSNKTIAKQFAYLKSTQVNKRLTLLINNFQSPENPRTRQTEDGYSDMNTLSSRDYHQMHNKALNKIISQQQKYMVDPYSTGKKSNEYQFNKTENFSSADKGPYGLDYTRELQVKNTMLEREVEELNSLLSQKCFELEKLDQEQKFLEEQGNKFLKKLGEKDNRIRELEGLYEGLLNQNQGYLKQIRQYREENQKLLEQAKLEQSQQQKQILTHYQSKIKELQHLVQSSEREQMDKFNREFKRKIEEKDKELQEIRQSVEKYEIQVKQHQINLMKLQKEKEKLLESNTKLQESRQEMEQLNNNLREQVFVYKSKVEESSTSKVQQYLEIALQSCKNQNQTLKRSKMELERSLESFVNTNRQTEQTRKQLEEKVAQLGKKLILAQEEVSKQETIKEAMKEEHHQQLMRVKEQNVQLLERISEEESEGTHRLSQIEKLKAQLFQKAKQASQLQVQLKNVQEDRQRFGKLLEQNAQLKQENSHLQERVRKYKKETKKELKEINTNAFEELRRIHDEKKQLARKVQKLQKTITQLQSKSGLYLPYEQKFSHREQDRARSKTNKPENQSQESELRASRSQSQQQPPRKVGIYRQRKELEDSKANSTNGPKNQDTNYELYELREFVNFIKNQQERFEHIFQLGEELSDPVDSKGRPLGHIKPLYKSIKFFKTIENKFKALLEREDQSAILLKENQFLRQKVTQSENKQVNHLTVNPQYQGSQIRNEEGTSFLMNKTGLTNAGGYQIVEFMKEEMKKQFNKQKESLKFNEEKYEILKKKIYREYRTRILEILNQKPSKKSSQALTVFAGKIQLAIERFIDSLSNVTHKEAVLNRQIKIKQNLKGQNSKLKQKIHQLEHILKEKSNGYCSRQAIKLYSCQNKGPKFQQEWMQSIKASTLLLTEKAENERLREQLQIVREDCNDMRQQLNLLLETSESKDSEIIRLKRNQIDLEKTYQRQLQKQNQILQTTKNKLGISTIKTKNKTLNSSKNKDKQRQIQHLRDELDKKTQQLKGFKEKQKKWQAFREQTARIEEKEQKLGSSYRRLEENTALLKDNNKELRAQNSHLKELVEDLKKELDKKKLYIKTLKGEDQESRTKGQVSSKQIQGFQEQIKVLEVQLKQSKEELAKARRQKEKQTSRMEGEIQSIKNEQLIHTKSLESVIRATIETIRKLFSGLRLIVKKKGLGGKLTKEEFQVPGQLVEVNGAQLYRQFQELLELLESL